MSTILFEREGKTSRISLVKETDDSESMQDFLTRMAASLVPVGSRWIAVDPSTLPTDSPPDRWIVNWSTGAITIANRDASELVAYAANKRWRVETGGCSGGDGQIVNTDRDSQTKLLAEMVSIGAGLRADPSGWKMRDGFAMLSNTQMLSVIGLARAHVATAFAVEVALSAGIAAGTITTFEQIDAANWPGISA